MTLYETIAGARPFAGRTAAELRASRHAGVRAWPGIPARVRRLLARGLASDPAERWPDMAAVARALRTTLRPRRAGWIAVAAVVPAAIVVWGLARASAAQCDAPDPGWTQRTSSATPWHARLAELVGAHGSRWREAYARTCAGPLADRQRACLVHARARIDGILDALGAEPALPAVVAAVAAIAQQPAPDRCLTAPDAIAEPDGPALVRPAALLALGRPRDALAALPAGDRDGPSALLRGRIALELQDLDTAAAALRRATELAGRDDAPAVLADAQTELAVVVGFMQDRPDAGVAYADAALATAGRLGDRRRAALARTAQGLVAYARGDVPAAVATLAIAIAELARDGDPLDLATAEMRLGWVLREARRTQEARAHLDHALALRRSTLAADHPLVALVELELGMTDAVDGKYADAIARYRSILARTERIAGATDRVVIGAWSALGAAQVSSGDYAGAEASFTRVLAARRAVYGDRHVDVARAYVNLASTAYYQGKLDRALESYRAAEAIARSILGGSHPEVATILGGLALALQASGRLADASAAITDAIAIYRARPGHDAALADALATRGMIELGLDHTDIARGVLEESRAIQERVLGADHVELAAVLATLGELYLGTGKLDTAELLLVRSRALRVQHGVAPQLVAENDFLLAMVARKRGKPAEATRLARSALAELGDARPELRQTIVDWLRASR